MAKTLKIIQRRQRRVFSGRQLERIRLKAKVSIVQLADALQVTRGCVYQWEAGQKRPSSDHVADIARTLNVSIETLYAEERFA
jgi:DNA-binding transcriptional regulator YiaG